MLIPREERLQKLYRIQNKNDKYLFRFNPMQADYDKKKGKRNIILKSRRLGFSTYKCLDGLDHIMHTKNSKATIICHTDKAAKELYREKVEYAWENIPSLYKDLYSVDKKLENKMVLDLGRGYKGTIETVVSARSGECSFLHISELAIADNKSPKKSEEIITGSIPACTGQVDIESTAMGAKGNFYEIFQNAWGKENTSDLEWKAHFYNWQWDTRIGSHTENDIKAALDNMPKKMKEYQKKFNLTDPEIAFYYYNWINLKSDWQLMHREFPTTPEEAFSNSKTSVFDIDTVNMLEVREPIKTIDGLRIYEDYIVGDNYTIGGDVAEGGGGDDSAIVVYNATKQRIAACWNDNYTDPTDLAYKLAEVGKMYGYALIGVENNSIGTATVSKLLEVYDNACVYKQGEEKYGWRTTVANKPVMIYDIKAQVNQSSMQFFDKKLIADMGGFNVDDIRGKGGTGHFDLLIAAAIAFQIAKQPEVWYIKK